MNKNFPAFCAILLAFALIITFCGGLWLNNNKLSFASSNEKTTKTVYLTFDDGPSDRVTPKVLDILAEEGVKATFFIIGKQAETRKYLIEREFKEGHTVAVHSYSHVYNEIYSSVKNLLNDIDRCNDVIYKITGKYSKLYRFPGGSFGLPTQLISAVRAHGMDYIDWNASTRDAEIFDATPNQLYQSAIATAANMQNIILLSHDSTTKAATVKALRDIIRHFKAEGYVFKAL